MTRAWRVWPHLEAVARGVAHAEGVPPACIESFCLWGDERCRIASAVLFTRAYNMPGAWLDIDAVFWASQGPPAGTCEMKPETKRKKRSTWSTQKRDSEERAENLVASTVVSR